ncbi:hypothetical protein Dimus_011739 [Dionaea muscipula]
MIKMVNDDGHGKWGWLIDNDGHGRRSAMEDDGLRFTLPSSSSSSSSSTPTPNPVCIDGGSGRAASRRLLHELKRKDGGSRGIISPSSLIASGVVGGGNKGVAMTAPAPDGGGGDSGGWLAMAFVDWVWSPVVGWSVSMEVCDHGYPSSKREVARA